MTMAPETEAVVLEAHVADATEQIETTVAEAPPAPPTAEAPAPIPPRPSAVPPTPPAPSSVEFEHQRQMAAMQQQMAEYQAREYRTRQVQEANAYRSQLEMEGVPAEQARTIAARQLQIQARAVDAENTAREYVEFKERQFRAAKAFIKQFGLGLDDLDDLLQYNDAAPMAAAAKLKADHRGLQAKVSKLEQTKVAPQHFDNNQPTASGAKADGNTIDVLWLKWENEHSGSSRLNPYDRQYEEYLAR